MTDMPTENKPVLLVLSTARKSPASVAEAVRLADEGERPLVAVFALEDETVRETVRKLAAEGWVGGGTADDFYDTVLAERKRLGRDKLGAAASEAERAGVSVETRLEHGSYDDVVRRVADEVGPTAIVLTRRRRSELSRFLLGSPIEKLAESLPYEVVLVDEE